MSLEDGFEITFSEDKKVLVNISDQGILVESEKEELTLHDLHYISSILFIYFGARARGIIPDFQEVSKEGAKLYHAFHNKYSNLKSIEEMNNKEFNEFMKESIKGY